MIKELLRLIAIVMCIAVGMIGLLGETETFLQKIIVTAIACIAFYIAYLLWNASARE